MELEMVWNNEDNYWDCFYRGHLVGRQEPDIDTGDFKRAFLESVYYLAAKGAASHMKQVAEHREDYIGRAASVSFLDTAPPETAASGIASVALMRIPEPPNCEPLEFLASCGIIYTTVGSMAAEHQTVMGMRQMHRNGYTVEQMQTYLDDGVQLLAKKMLDVLGK